MKQEMMNCEKCGKEIVRRNSVQKYCTKCSNIANREKTKARRSSWKYGY